MDENFDKKRSDIDLTAFDLTPFKELFAEEDAQKEAEKKAREEQKIIEEKEIAQKEEEVSPEKEAEEAAAIEEARIKAEKKAAREKEEARRAAEKEAMAILAAKRAEEARKEADMAKSARLLERAEAENTIEIINEEEETTAEEVKEENLDSFASILTITNEDGEAQEEQRDKIELTDEYFNYTPEMPSPKSGIYSAICAVLILAFIGCTAFAGYTYFFKGKNKAEASNTEYIGTSPAYAPYSDLAVKYPAALNENINPDLKTAYALNNETVGWLSIDGTPVDYPIVQSADNTKYLSYTNFYGKGARYGTPFMDFRCDALGLSKNTIIYSHHMNNNLFFGSLDNYENSNYYKDHPYIEYQTLNGNYKFKVYAVFYATTEAESDGGFVFDYYNPNMSDDNFKGYIELLDQYAIYKTDAGLTATDKIITLSTCTHVYDNLKKGGVDTRLVVVGRMLRDGEDASTGNETVTENSEYRRPQIWYDASQKDNPYASYRTWRASL